jgi:hypothetical protein
MARTSCTTVLRRSRFLLERGVWCQFAAAEADSGRYGDLFERVLGRDQAIRLRTSPIGSWTDTDCAAARRGVTAIRGDYLRPIFDAKPDWSIGWLPVEQLARVQVIRLTPFLAIAPERDLYTFVRALDEGRDTPGDGFGAGYRKVRPNFDPGRMRGCPILVGRNDGGPYTEVEGLTRMSCILSRHLAGEPRPAEVEVVLGVSPRINEWPFL